jgi:putative DNA primase/helicase
MQLTSITLADLASRQMWVGWRQEKRDGRPTKVPYDPRTGRRAESDNATTWASREEAESWTTKERGDGVGIMLCAVDGAHLCGIDLDTCRDKDTGDIASCAQEIIDRFASYTEVSPSGTGVKVFFAIANADLAAVVTLFDGKQGRAFKTVAAASIRRRSRSIAGGTISPSPTSRSGRATACGPSISTICAG